MTANVYTFHSGMPGAPQITAAGAAGQLHDILYACGVTGFGGGTLDSLTRSGSVATATRSAGLNLADGISGMPHVVKISGSSNGWDGEYLLNATPGSTACTFACDSGLPTPATGAITLVRAPAGMTRLANASNKSVWQFSDIVTLPGYLMLDDSSATMALVRLAETAASPVDHSTMTGLCPTAAQSANGLYWGKTNAGGSNRSWILVIWKGGLYLFVKWNSSYVGYEIAYAGACITRKAGDGYPGIIIGNTSSPSTPNGNHSGIFKSGAQTGHYLQRDYTNIGSALQFMKASTIYGSRFGERGPPWPNPTDNQRHLRGPVDIIEGTANTGNLRGKMPLLYDPVGSAGGAAATLDILENIATLSGRKILIVALAYGTSDQYPVALDITGPAS